MIIILHAHWEGGTLVPVTFDLDRRRRLAPAGLAPLDLAVSAMDLARFFSENIPRLLVLWRRHRRRHGFAEASGSIAAIEGRSKSTIFA